MFSHKRHTGKLAKSATAIAAASVLAAAAAHASDVAAPKMTLTAYVNGAGGESVLAGKYDTALAEIKKDRSTSTDAYIAKVTNECVAYAAVKQLPQALSACNEAIRAARYDRMTSLRYAPGSTMLNSYVAIAYTNRAVVHIMAKDP